MAIVNRALDSSEQSKVLDFKLEVPVTTGQTGAIVHVPFPCTVQAAQMTAFGVQSNANLLFTVSRFIAGAGTTVWALGSTFVPVAFGTSGYPTSGVSLPASGSTLLQLMANDIIGFVGGGGSTAGIYGCVGSFVVKPMQDSRVYLAGLV